MKAKTQYTPRANFHDSALTSIIKPTSDGYVPKIENTMLYEGPDEHNTCFDIPEGGTDVFNVVTGRRQLSKETFRPLSSHEMSNVGDSAKVDITPMTRNLEDSITPGKGWEIYGGKWGFCDGTYNATCERDTKDDCFLYGHHDGRGAVVGNEFSGWLVMTLKDLKEGVIMLKLHTWYREDESTVTKGWTSVNNERRRLGQSSIPFNTNEFYFGKTSDESNEPVGRMLMQSYHTPKLPDEFAFEYAIDGAITTLTGDQFLDRKKQIQRVVEIITILDDPNFTSESKDVEIAIRLRGSGRGIVFGVSHVYWA